LNLSTAPANFFTQVEGKTFNQAMQITTETSDYDHSEREIREDHGNDAKIVR
jgi:hypothetical protein